MPYKSQAQRRFMHANHPEIARKWDKEFPNQKGLPMRAKKHKKAVISVNNKMKDSLGRMEPDTNKVEINIKKHKGDKAELASTVKHELLHVKHPKMTEKEVYKRSAKTKIAPKEQTQLLAKLRNKKINNKIGGLKRKFKMKREESVKPGTFISKANDLKRTAVMGLV